MAFFYVLLSIITVLCFPVFAGIDVYFDLSRKILLLNVKPYGLSVCRITVDENDGIISYRAGKKGNKPITIKSGANDIIKAVIIRKVKISMRLDAGEAAITALLSAALSSTNTEKIQVTCIPDYDKNYSIFANVTVFTLPILGVIYGIKRLKKYA